MRVITSFGIRWNLTGLTGLIYLQKMEGDETGESTSSKELSPNPRLTGLKLFTKKWYRNRKGKTGQAAVELNREAVKAWRALSDAEILEYKEKAEKARPPKRVVKSTKYFCT